MSFSGRGISVGRNLDLCLVSESMPLFKRDLFTFIYWQWNDYCYGVLCLIVKILGCQRLFWGQTLIPETTSASHRFLSDIKQLWCSFSCFSHNNCFHLKALADCMIVSCRGCECLQTLHGRTDGILNERFFTRWLTSTSRLCVDSLWLCNHICVTYVTKQEWNLYYQSHPCRKNRSAQNGGIIS